MGEIGEVIFADRFRQIFAGVGSQTFPRAQSFHVHQPEVAEQRMEISQLLGCCFIFNQPDLLFSDQLLLATWS